MNKILTILVTGIIVLSGQTFGITPTQTDDFQSGSPSNWTSGTLNPNPPTIISTGGPSGAGDMFLRATANGALGAGGKLVILNSIQWTGDYITPNITRITMKARNSGSSLLRLRLAFNGPAGWFVSTAAVIFPTGNTWQTLTFPIQSGDLTGVGNANTTLAGVTEMRILHNSTADFHGEIVIGQLDVDDITAVGSPQAVKDNNLVPLKFDLKQNYPNPFNPGTRISYTIPDESYVKIVVYNAVGVQVKEIINVRQPAGSYNVNFNGSRLSSGVYFYSIEANALNGNSFKNTKKMILLK